MSHSFVLVTGANRGLGFGFVEELLKDANDNRRVIAAVRSSNAALDALVQSSGNKMHVVTGFDLTDDVALIKCVQEIESIVTRENGSLDDVWLNAALISDKSDKETCVQSFTANAYGNWFFARALLPLVRRATGRKLFVFVSSVAASMTHMYGGGSPGTPAYKMSKAAENMAMRILAAEPDNAQVLFVALNPGGVATETLKQMIGPDNATEAKGWKTPGNAARKLIRIADVLNLKEHRAMFINHRYLDEGDAEKGTFLPW